MSFLKERSWSLGTSRPTDATREELMVVNLNIGCGAGSWVTKLRGGMANIAGFLFYRVSPYIRLSPSYCLPPFSVAALAETHPITLTQSIYLCARLDVVCSTNTSPNSKSNIHVYTYYMESFFPLDSRYSNELKVMYDSGSFRADKGCSRTLHALVLITVHKEFSSQEPGTRQKVTGQIK